MKGVGFFVGGLLLRDRSASSGALWLMAGAARRSCCSACWRACRAQLGKAKASKCFARAVRQDRAAINLLAAARIFLFGARDVWFVVGLPVFLYARAGSYMEVGRLHRAPGRSATALVQAIAPSVMRRSADGLSREVPEARLWGAVLTAIPLVLALLLQSRTVARPDLVVVVGLGIFGFAFAVDLVAAFLSDPRLCRIGEGGRRCRLLLRGQCRRPADRHPALRHPHPSGRPGRLPVGFGGHARAVPGDHLAAADSRRAAARAGLTVSSLPYTPRLLKERCCVTCGASASFLDVAPGLLVVRDDQLVDALADHVADRAGGIGEQHEGLVRVARSASARPSPACCRCRCRPRPDRRAQFELGHVRRVHLDVSEREAVPHEVVVLIEIDRLPHGVGAAVVDRGSGISPSPPVCPAPPGRATASRRTSPCRPASW